jgi:7-cyano-7-deazaguanine synthase in queuosine biosynthesis
MAAYFDLSASRGGAFVPDDVILFSGGLDSLGGAVEALRQGKKIALVSHRSAPKIFDVQKFLVSSLKSRVGTDRVHYIPVWMTLKTGVTQEQTHRSRSFLYAALGAATAFLFGVNAIFFFENGVVSLNLPSVPQVIGARATRTTHPQVMAGFRRILSNLLGRPFDVRNPYIWNTKAEVVASIARNGYGDLIRHTRSCTRIREMTKMHSHCGRCSQCIDRRFAVLASGQDSEDPEEAYDTGLLTGRRQAGPDRELALGYIHTASAINRMTDAAFFARYGETSRVVDFFTETPAAVASRIFDLHRRHAASVCGVFEQAIKQHAASLREGSLSEDCLLRLVVGQPTTEPPRTAEQRPPAPPVPEANTIMMAVDPTAKRVLFSRWGNIKGANATLLIALAGPFEQASNEARAPMRYPFTRAEALAREVSCSSDETLRRLVHRCRKTIGDLAQSAGDRRPPFDAVIETYSWRGYRLNPDRIRLVALSEMEGSGHAFRPKGHDSRAKSQRRGR